MKNMKTAVIYCRVSTDEQVDGYSLTSQEEICRAFAERNGYEVGDVFIEKGESAKTADRTQLQLMLKHIIRLGKKVNALIIYKVDRLVRDSDDLGIIRAILKRYGITLLGSV